MHTVVLSDWPTAHQTLRRLADWVKARTLSGRPVTLTVADERRTLAQNDLIQPVVREICQIIGRTDHDTVRALMMEQWRYETKRPQVCERSLDGLRMVDVSNRTSRLDKADASEFIDWLNAWKSNNEQ